MVEKNNFIKSEKITENTDPLVKDKYLPFAQKIELAKKLFLSKKIDEAVKLFEELVFSEYPDKRTLHFYAGLCYYKQKNTEKAYSHLILSKYDSRYIDKSISLLVSIYCEMKNLDLAYESYKLIENNIDASPNSDMTITILYKLQVEFYLADRFPEYFEIVGKIMKFDLNNILFPKAKKKDLSIFDINLKNHL